jgi:hypothetical protein
MHFEGDDTKTLVTYIAEFEFKGVARAAQPILKPLLNKIADDGARGMADALQRLPVANGA